MLQYLGHKKAYSTVPVQTESDLFGFVAACHRLTKRGTVGLALAVGTCMPLSIAHDVVQSNLRRMGF